jgi:hypothetical protein
MMLAQRQPDGCTTAEHLRAVAASTGVIDPALQVQVPREGAALWTAFCDLASERLPGMAPAAIQGAQIESWQRLSGVVLTPWEVDTLRAMDRAALAVASKSKGAAV